VVAVHNESHADVPFQDAVGMIRTREASYFLDWVARLQANDMVMPAFGLYFQDQVAGLALFEMRAVHPKTASIIYTGVARAFRRRGLGRHLKASTTLRLMELYPGLRFLVTGNEETNQPILSINKAMGFEVKSEFTMLRYQARPV
jgi:ribosomal protein S18 acetylase RimI-like enzyme